MELIFKTDEWEIKQPDVLEALELSDGISIAGKYNSDIGGLIQAREILLIEYDYRYGRYGLLLGENVLLDQKQIIGGYSTSEQKIGDWYDGVKSVYRKVITGTTPSSAGWNVLTTLTCDNIMSMKGFLIYDNRDMPLPYTETNYSVIFDFLRTNQQIRINIEHAAFSSRPFTLIVEYIK